MRIGLVICSVEVGGTETFLRRLYSCLTERGHDVEIVEVERRGAWADTFQAEGVRIVDVLPGRFASKLAHARTVAGALQCYDAILLNDVAVAQSALGLVPGGAVCVPIVNLDIPSFYQNAVGNAGEWDVVVAVGPLIGERLKNEYGLDGAQVRCIPYGVEVQEEWPKRRMEGVDGKELRAAFVGRLDDWQKGIMRLPPIVQRAMAMGQRVGVDVIGDGPDRGLLERAVAEDGLGGSIRLLGALGPAETGAALSEYDALLLPSNFEGLPIVVMEAMAAGVVPIASRLRKTTEFQIEDGRTGFLCEAGDVDAYARALAILGSDASRRMEMSRAAWSEARQRFRVGEMGGAYADLVEELQDSKKTRASRCRSRRIAEELLGDLPRIPACAIRPVRRTLRTVGVWRGQ